MFSTLTGVERSLTLADLMAQLKAEIGTAFDGNFSAFARTIGVNRQQLTRYLSGERDMGLDRLMASIAAVGVTPEDFFARARRRATAAHQPTGD